MKKHYVAPATGFLIREQTEIIALVLPWVIEKAGVEPLLRAGDVHTITSSGYSTLAKQSNNSHSNIKLCKICDGEVKDWKLHIAYALTTLIKVKEN